MLTEFLGNDLSKIANELNKLEIVVGAQKEITPEIIEENIGISKDFNNFELQKALGTFGSQKSISNRSLFCSKLKTTSVCVDHINLVYVFYKIDDLAYSSR